MLFCPVVTDPFTTADILTEIAEIEDSLINKAIIVNPNSPDTLVAKCRKTVISP
jgi:hypothetical protein